MWCRKRIFSKLGWRKRRHPFTQVGHKTKVTRLLTRPTWGMKWGSFGYIVFHKDGCTLIDKCFHTLRMSLKGSQIQRGAAFLIPDVQVYQRLQKDFQGLVVAVVGLQRRNQQLKCSLSLNPTESIWRAEPPRSQRETTSKSTRVKPELGAKITVHRPYSYVWIF